MTKDDYFDEDGYLQPGNCLANAERDEPVFVLRANDPIAADIVEIWATLASKCHEFEKVQSAQAIATHMRHWKIDRMEQELENL